MILKYNYWKKYIIKLKQYRFKERSEIYADAIRTIEDKSGCCK